MGILLVKFEKGKKILLESQQAYSEIQKKAPLKELTLEELLDFSLAFSQGVQIIRNTLDHAMWNLARQHSEFDETSPTVCRSISFPIKYSQNAFNNWKNASGKYYEPDVIDFVESLQPYEGRIPYMYRKAVETIAKLDNFSKHRSHLEAVQVHNTSIGTRVTVDDQGNLIKTPFKTIHSLDLRLQAIMEEGNHMIVRQVSYSFSEMEIFSPFREIICRFDENNFNPLPPFMWEWDKKKWEDQQEHNS